MQNESIPGDYTVTLIIIIVIIIIIIIKAIFIPEISISIIQCWSLQDVQDISFSRTLAKRGLFTIYKMFPENLVGQ